MVAFVALLPALLAAAEGVYQISQSSKYSKQERPEFEITPEMKRRMANAEMMAQQRELPGQDIIENKIREATASGLSNLKMFGQSGGQMIEGLAKLIGGEQRSFADLGVASAQNYSRNQEMLRNELGIMNKEARDEWQYNKYMPYLQSQQTAKELEQAGMQNVLGAFNVVASATTQEKMWGDYMKMLEGAEIPKTQEQMKAPSTASPPEPVKTEFPDIGAGTTDYFKTKEPTSLNDYLKSPGLSSYLGSQNTGKQTDYFSEFYDYISKYKTPDYLLK